MSMEVWRVQLMKYKFRGGIYLKSTLTYDHLQFEIPLLFAWGKNLPYNNESVRIYVYVVPEEK